MRDLGHVSLWGSSHRVAHGRGLHTKSRNAEGAIRTHPAAGIQGSTRSCPLSDDCRIFHREHHTRQMTGAWLHKPMGAPCAYRCQNDFARR